MILKGPLSFRRFVVFFHLDDFLISDLEVSLLFFYLAASPLGGGELGKCGGAWK